MITSYIIGKIIKSGKIIINNIITIYENSLVTDNPIFKAYLVIFLTDHIGKNR